MVMSWIYLGTIGVALAFSVLLGNAQSLSAAITTGAQSGITLAVNIAGSICLWSGIGKLMEANGITGWLAKLLSPILHRIFPSTKTNPEAAGALTANVCANLLGLGNAATPMGITAVKRLQDPGKPAVATDEICRLIVLNTASIQLIPANVAAVRASYGCVSPFDILPAVWLTSFASAGVGVLAAILLGKLWRHD